MNNIWQLQDAKSKFSELVERTLVNGVTDRHVPRAENGGDFAIRRICTFDQNLLTAWHSFCWLLLCGGPN